MLIPNSQFISSPPFPFGGYQYVCYFKISHLSSQQGKKLELSFTPYRCCPCLCLCVCVCVCVCLLYWFSISYLILSVNLPLCTPMATLALVNCTDYSPLLGPFFLSSFLPSTSHTTDYIF